MKERLEVLSTKRGNPSTSSGQGGGAGARKVSLGTVPDFAFEGEGVRLDGTVAGSPAEKAGLKEGDVITGMNGKPVKELRDLSNILKSLKAGDEVLIELLREGEKVNLEAVLQER